MFVKHRLPDEQLSGAFYPGNSSIPLAAPPPSTSWVDKICDQRCVTVHITIVDINEYGPTFLEPAYVRSVDEGRLYEEIIRIEATDRDCSPKFGDICKYEILNGDQPFTIDNEGSIRNIEPLDYERSHNYILSVVAYDCGMKQSTPVMVTIKVNRICKLGWKGVPERVDYAPLSGVEILFPSAQLKLCDIPCNINRVSSRLTLSTSHIGKGCDRDTYSVQSQRKICGASSESVDLLPTPGAPGSEWTKTLATDEGHESDQMFEFDGVSSAVAIPNDVLDHSLSSTFTIATWMKHKLQMNQDKLTKEHILCSADDHKMNRHHYSWFVRNCRLILLLRRDFTQGDLNIFRPAEWRWKIPQVCDNEWHHYAVSIQFPNVQLYIDGVLFRPQKKNPEVIDDWPLHPTADINTTLTVGACWQGSEKRMKHHFRGYLAGLSVLLHKTEKPEVLACLHKCKESLEVPAMDYLEPGMELLSSNDLTEITIEGDNKTNMETLVKNIGYSNSREFPTPGRRNLHLSTSISCDNGHSIKVPPVESYVMVLQPQQPSITINGSNNVAREYNDFRGGVRIFPDLRISVDDDNKQSKAFGFKSSERKLDSCIVSIYPSLNPDHEALTLPEARLQQFNILAKISKDGASISGPEFLHSYELVLREIEYTNQKPAYYLNRVFKLICSELNGRFLSNEYIQTLTVIHPKILKTAAPASSSNNDDNMVADSGAAESSRHIPPQPAHIMINQHHVESQPAKTVFGHYLDNAVNDQAETILSGGSHAIAVIIVVCIGFLMLMIALGVIRIRAAHNRATQEEIQETEMAWDDSALNIIVNPMEQLECGSIKTSANSENQVHDDDDSSDDNISYEYDSSDDDDDNGHTATAKVKDLEWDDDTLAV
ncbi:hypothetical protein V9T40_011117 [Parthenolecanium corni]|uniref:Cadherin domain-containing protein n=1 Tax=Parthenolecanium corni TaxID=536013 RepID=A0AAN9XXU7_9HEMI